MLEHVIKGLLLQNDMSGYDIKQNISDVKFFKASYGSIYPCLKKMELERLITVREIIEGGRYKKIYSLSADGKDQFFDWLHTPCDVMKSDSDHLVKLFFYQYLPNEKAKDLIAVFLKRLDMLIHRLELTESLLSKDLNTYQNATFTFGIDYYRFVKDWYTKFLETLK
jgi:DNA-binding PadR family transcriptional regulator